MLYDKHSIHGFEGNDIVLPLVILEELDKFKDRRGLLGDAARYVNRYLDEMRSIEKPLGWRFNEKYNMRYRFEVAPDLFQLLPEGLDIGYNDNHIIACALYLRDKNKDTEVKVITKDINLRVKCDAVGVYAEDYYKDHVDDDVTSRVGWTKLEVSNQNVDEFYSEGSVKIGSQNLLENQFVIAKSEEQKGFLAINSKGELKKLHHKLDGYVNVEPRNSEQTFAIEALMNPKIKLVTLTGLAGSGKTFLTLMAGLASLKASIGNSIDISELVSSYERLVITRTLQPVGRDLGYLPGSMHDKMAPWLMPIIDNVRHAFKDIGYFEAMIQKGDIEIAPIPYIRGRTFNDSFVIVDEAQNATIHELKTIITRIGTNSKIVLLGDVDQIDTPYINRQSNGLSIVIDKFKNKGYHILENDYPPPIGNSKIE